MRLLVLQNVSHVVTNMIRQQIFIFLNLALLRSIKKHFQFQRLLSYLRISFFFYLLIGFLSWVSWKCYLRQAVEGEKVRRLVMQKHFLVKTRIINICSWGGKDKNRNRKIFLNNPSGVTETVWLMTSCVRFSVCLIYEAFSVNIQREKIIRRNLIKLSIIRGCQW